MYLVVGLGNPGDEYEDTRHNAGFRAVDQVANRLQDPSENKAVYWKEECGAFVSHVLRKGTQDADAAEIILAKPQSFMNASGGPVKKICQQYKIDEKHLVVLHDDLDIEEGTIRIKFGGGSAGHNGIKSIIEKLGTPQWLRVRIGIGRPPGKMDPADYVLSIPKKQQRDNLDSAISQAAKECIRLIDTHFEGC